MGEFLFDVVDREFVTPPVVDDVGSVVAHYAEAAVELNHIEIPGLRQIPDRDFLLAGTAHAGGEESVQRGTEAVEGIRVLAIALRVALEPACKEELLVLAGL